MRAPAAAASPAKASQPTPVGTTFAPTWQSAVSRPFSAVAADATARHLVGGEPHTPTSDWELVHGAVHYAKELGQPLRVGPIVSSDLFYNPDNEQYDRWCARGILAVEMEAAVLFTLGALRGVQAGCLLTVSDVVVEKEFKRISDEELRAAVDRMTRIALATATAEPKH